MIGTTTMTVAARITSSRSATGQFVTPTAMRGAVQQFLNPGLPAYPNFVAGEAVRSQLSPDGTTLAIIYGRPELALQAGRHGRRRPTRRSSSSSTTSSGANKARPGADAGDPADQRPRRPGLLAGRQHALRRRRQRRRGVRLHQERRPLRAGAPIALGHFALGATGSARTRASASASARTPAAWTSPPTAATLVVANNYNDSISVIDTATRHGPLRARPASVLRQQRRHATAASAARSRSRSS